MAKNFDNIGIKKQQKATTLAKRVQETNYTIDPEFEAFNPALPQEQREELKASIQKQGFLDSVKYWMEAGSDHRLIIDGHNRLSIARELGLENMVTFEQVPGLKSREDVRIWIDTFQFSRRNYSPFQLSFVRGRLYENRKQRGFHQNDGNGQTAVLLAKEHNTSQATIERDAALYRALDQRVNPILKQEILNENKAKVKKGDLVKLGQQKIEENPTLFQDPKEITDFLQQQKKPAQSLKISLKPNLKTASGNELELQFPAFTAKEDRFFPLYAKEKEAHYLFLSPKHCIQLLSLEIELLAVEKSSKLYQRFLDHSIEEVSYTQFTKAANLFFSRLQKDIAKAKAWQEKTTLKDSNYLATTKGHWEISKDRIHYFTDPFAFDEKGYEPVATEAIKVPLQQALSFFAAVLSAPQKPARNYHAHLMKKLS